MEKYIDNIRKVNAKFVDLLNGLSTEQLNKIPAGFKNNIIWNFAHVLAVQQSLFYRLSGLPVTIDESIITSYRSGTRPEKNLDITGINRLKEVFSYAINTFENDYKKGIFIEYKAYTTSFAVVLESIDDAVQFSIVHDGLHLGYAMAMKHLL